MKTVFMGLALILCAGCTAAQPGAKTEPVSSARADAPEALRVWVDGRAGTGAPVHWVSEGNIFEYPSGKKLFGMIGFDSSTVLWPTEPDGVVTHLTRKTYAYTDPDTGAVLTEYNGQPVEPIAYPYQLITYRMDEGLIYGDVEQGVGARVQKIKAKNGIPATKMGSSYYYNASVFLDIPLPSGTQLEAWENYDFFIHPEGSVDEPHQMSWQRFGDLPPWAGDGKAIYHLLSHRVESTDAFPPVLLDWAKAEKPMWLTPPASLEEVRALQTGEDGAGWGQ